MGWVDVKIQQARRNRNQILERLKSSQVTCTQPCDAPGSSTSANPPDITVEIHPLNPSPQGQEVRNGRYMAVELYRAASNDDTDGLVAVLAGISARKGLALSEIIEQVSPLGNTLLHLAASHGCEENVRLMVRHFPSLVMKQNSSGDTALHLAIRAGHVSVISTLHRVRRNPFDNDTRKNLQKVRNVKGNTALHELMNRSPSSWVYWVWLGFKNNPELPYLLNNEGKSPVYLAAETGKQECLSELLLCGKQIGNEEQRLKGKSPLQAAVMRRNIAIIDIILNEEPAFINLPDEEGQTPLHHAASHGYMDVIQCLLGRDVSCTMERDNNGFFPIHYAAANGHIEATKELLQHCPDPREMLNHNGQNILHIAAARGANNVVSFILQTPTLECLINEGDQKGNTPLHLATMNWHPKIVSAMTWDERVKLETMNNEGLTALDAAEYYMETSTLYAKRLTWTALKAAGAPRAPRNMTLKQCERESCQSELSNTDTYKDRVNTLLLVATLVATITFAAGFTMPGGYNDSIPNQGMATMLQKRAFFVFVFSDTIAMYSSILVAISLVWAQLGDLTLMLTAFRVAVPLLGLALAMMSLAFMAGVYLVVSQLTWLAYAVLIMGSAFLVALSVLFLPLCFPISSGNCFLRYLTYYPFHLLVLVTVRK